MTELDKLHDLLDQANIEHVVITDSNGFYERHMIKMYEVQNDAKTEILSAICHYGSYGFEQGKIEIMGLLTKSELKHDSVVGHLTARNVFKRIKKHMEETL